MVEKASVVIVKKFIDTDSRPVGMTEMTTFWKSCTDEEKLQFTNEAVTLMPHLAR